MWLGSVGYRVQVARNGREALENVRTTSLLMVVDLMMPLMGGAELRRRQQALPSIDRSPVAVSREV